MLKVKARYLEFSDQSVSLTPFYKPLGSHFDPALTIGGELHHLNTQKSTVFHQVETTLFSHALTGSGIALSTSIGYRVKLPLGIFTDISIGLSGSAFISGRESFSLTESGVYERRMPVHALIGVPIDLGLGYSFDKLAIYVRYRYQVEGNYTDILPVLPGSLLGIGVRQTITQN